MALIRLDVPAGVYRNGTDLQSMGRWRDASLVRWIDGTMQPVKGWLTRSDTATAAKMRGMINWSDNSNDRWYAAGTYNKLYVYGGSTEHPNTCLLYTSPSPRDGLLSRMPSSA